MSGSQHIPVLLHETIQGLKLRDGVKIVDMTLGRGGHSELILKSGYKNITLIGIDADQDAVAESTERLSPVAESTGNNLIIENVYNDKISDVLKKHKIEFVEGCIFDLGISSPQVDSSGRGFTFTKDEPLDMAMSKESDLTAKEIVNTWEETSIADIIYGYGEERYSRRIAKAIVESRKKKEIETTFELVEIIKSSVPKSYLFGKIHPATRTFQALRITVNNELERLKKSIRDIFQSLSPGGRIVVISFHSLEDRIIKRFFKQLEDETLGIRITKKPLIPKKEEIINNPRSRSAKLRIFEKTS